MFACIAGAAICASAAVRLYTDRAKRVVVSPPKIDVGSVLSSGLVRVEFTVTNATSQAVHLAETFKNCDCTNAECSVKALEPGQAAHCSIDWSTRGRSGPTSTSVGQTWRIMGSDTAWLGKVAISCFVSTEQAFITEGPLLHLAGNRPTFVKLHSSLKRPDVQLHLNATSPLVRAELRHDSGSLMAEISAKSKSLPPAASVVLEVRDKNASVKYELPVDVAPDG